MSGPTLPQLIARWPRITARARLGWSATFAAKIARLSKDASWRPTAGQLEAMRDLHDELDGETPEYGEERTRADGQLMFYRGGLDGWVPVYQ